MLFTALCGVCSFAFPQKLGPAFTATKAKTAKVKHFHCSHDGSDLDLK
jgi:hypothetical protein